MIKSTKRPRVIANFALTADGKVSTRNLTPTGFTSKTDKRRLLEIRSLGDAVLAGARTVKTDRMSMRITVEDLRERRSSTGKPPEPLRVIVSNSGAIDSLGRSSRRPELPILVFSSARMSQDCARVNRATCGSLDLRYSRRSISRSMLQILRSDYHVRTLVCEGGPRLFRNLLEIGAVDELHLTWTPLIFGGVKAPTLIGVPDEFLPATIRCHLKDMHVEGDECFLTYSL